MSDACTLASAAAPPAAPITSATPIAPLWINLVGMPPAKLEAGLAITRRFPPFARYQLQKMADGIHLSVSPDPHAPGVLCGSPANIAELDDTKLQHPTIGVSVMGVVLNRKHQMMVVTRRKGGWKFVLGGMVREGETLWESLRRNIFEKTGVWLPNDWPAQVYRLHESFLPKYGVHNVMAFLGPIVIDFDGEFVVPTAEDCEISAAEWMHPALFYAAYLKDSALSQPSIVPALQHVADQYVASYEFKQNTCFLGASESSGNPLLYALTHMMINDGSLERGATHGVAAKRTAQLLA